MLYLSIGMPRAGSGWYYNLMHDLVVASGGVDARQVRSKYHLGRVLTEVNCNIGAFTPWRLIPVCIPALLGNSYVIKAHAAPSPLAKYFIRRNWLKATYIYRDPRDAMLSAYENGQNAIKNGRRNAFSHLGDFPATLRFMKDYVAIAEAWMACPQVLHTRYEDLLADFDREADRLVDFLGIVKSNDVQAILDHYRPAQARAADQQGLHFRKGKIGRFEQAYSADEKQACLDAFGAYLERMGYPA
jgi:hypothetical protein